MRIGLLGGSFNPAHHGHQMIAEAALRRLGLDQVWLMVSPGNPLKSGKAMAPLAQRLASAQAIARNPRIIATAIEASLGTVFTTDTLRCLATRFPNARFVWLTGSDNFVELPRWRNWRGICRRIPIAVFPRPGSSLRARAGKAAQSFPCRPAREAQILAQTRPPAWLFLQMREDSVSSTSIRARIVPVASGD